MINTLRVLKHFVEHKDKEYTIKKVAEALHINYKIVYEEILKLKQEELIHMEKQGNANRCAFAYTYHHKIVAIEEQRKQEILRNKDMHVLYERMKDIANPFYCFIIFGSHAKQSAQKHSDIDICILADNPEIHTQIREILSITPINAHIQEFSTKQFLQMIQSKQDNLGNQIVKNNVVLYGLELFYKLVNNVT